jgi:hypothetical protein
MHATPLTPGFSTADTSYPELASGEGTLHVRFDSSAGEPVRVGFVDVAAFSWREAGDDPLLPGERWDGTSELFDSPLLHAHSPGRTMHSSRGPLRHLRLNFNDCGSLDVLCTAFARLDAADAPSLSMES